MTGSSLISWFTVFDPKEDNPGSFVSISSLEVCQEGGGPSWGYLEDNYGS